MTVCLLLSPLTRTEADGIAGSLARSVTVAPVVPAEEGVSILICLNERMAGPAVPRGRTFQTVGQGPVFAGLPLRCGLSF